MSDHSVRTDEHEPVGHDSHEEIAHGGIGKYLVVFAALCVLTTLFVLYVLPVLGASNMPKQASRRS